MPLEEKRILDESDVWGPEFIGKFGTLFHQAINGTTCTSSAAEAFARLAYKFLPIGVPLKKYLQSKMERSTGRRP
jgi:hypothetical protein